MERLTHFFEGEYRMNYGVGIYEAVQRFGQLEDENAALIKELEQKRKIVNRLYEYIKMLKERSCK